MKRAVLYAQALHISHANSNVHSFEQMLGQWNITKFMHVVIRNNARNISNTMEECSVASLGCMPHTLQLAVNEGILSQRSISEGVSIRRKRVGYLKHSHLVSVEV